MKRREFLAALAVGTLARPGRRPEPRLVERWSWAMGQPVHLTLYHRDEAAGYEAARDALAGLRRVEARLSRFEDASDLSEVNRRAGRGWVRVGAELAAVLAGAESIRRRTGGGFNPAVEPLMAAWGFREPRKAPPGARELEQARAAVAAAVVERDEDRVRLPSAHTRLDLGGIGVGYALDVAAGILRSHGVESALLDVSGDLLAIGAPPGRAGWEIEIAAPRQEPGTDPPAGGVARVLTTITIRDRALATSANSASVVRLGARLAGHVMDPFRGVPADRVLQVTAVARTGLAADALSTASLVAGRLLPGTDGGWVV